MRCRKCRRSCSDVELGLPNLLADDVPDGNTESDNAEVRRWGEPTDLGFRSAMTISNLVRASVMLDFEAASRISGARFTVMAGPLARLQRALIQFMLDTHTE